jgi:peroxiredoxin
VTISRRALLAGLAAAGSASLVRAEPLPLVQLPGNVAAPDFALPDLDGHTHRLADYRGRPLLVSFWATWCPSCRREMPALAALRKAIADDGIAVVAIDVGDRADNIRNFLQAHSVEGLTVLRDADKKAATAWHVMGLPCAYGVTATSELRLGALGARDWTAPAIENQLRRLR